MDTKINISVGNLSFSAEGEPAWLAEQLDKVLKAAPQVAEVRRPDDVAASGGAEKKSATVATQTLATYIRDKNTDSNQVERFLITADWLRRRGSSLSTFAVSKALKDNHQTKLANPADCLNKNVSKGFCEKTSDGFFITPEGLKHLGAD